MQVPAILPASTRDGRTNCVLREPHDAVIAPRDGFFVIATLSHVYGAF
jgi:hypothetical protein